MIAYASDMHWREAEQGYTLIELIVVMVLISLFLGLGLPRVRDVIFHDELKTSALQIVSAINSCRELAVKKQTFCKLHFDLDGGRYWLDVKATLSPETESDFGQPPEAEKEEKDIHEDVRIVDVWHKNKGQQAVGEAVILFTKKGYAEEAVINLESDSGDKLALVVNSFMRRVDIHDSHLNFE